MIEAACARPEPVEFWARQFAECWYRGQGHVANDFRRFVSAHRIPPDAHEEVCERAQELLLVCVPAPLPHLYPSAPGRQTAAGREMVGT